MTAADAVLTQPGGEELHRRIGALLPIPRSLTGDGVRATLAALAEWADVRVHEVPTGTQVFDWTVPEEWNLRRAVLTDPTGQVIADSDDTPLAVVGYSDPVDTIMSLEALQPHLHSLPDQPDVTPYRTSYYARSWGFCLPDRVRQSLPDGDYRVSIDATLAPGSLTYGEVVIPGSGDEIGLISAHTCHPAMANDNASGMVVASALAAHLASRPRRLTWRIIFAPGTLGSLVWLHANPQAIPRIRAGVVLAGVGDGGDITVKRTRHGDTLIDRVLSTVLRDRGQPWSTADFSPWGYDERQYGSPGFDLPVTLFMRTPHGTYPQYHTSADDASFVTAGSLADSLDALADVVEAIEANGCYVNDKPHGEPQLGKRGLYPTTGGQSARTAQMAMLWVLSLSDGRTDLLAIADRSGLALGDVVAAAEALAGTDLLHRVGEEPGLA